MNINTLRIDESCGVIDSDNIYCLWIGVRSCDDKLKSIDDIE